MIKSSEIKSASLKSAYEVGIVKKISSIRANKNNLLFITLIAPNENFNNFYLTKKTSKIISKGDILSSKQIKNSKVVLSKNKNGETRLKFLISKSSDYTNLITVFESENICESEVLSFLNKEIQTDKNIPEDEEYDEVQEMIDNHESMLKQDEPSESEIARTDFNNRKSTNFSKDTIIILFVIGILFVLIFGINH